PIWNFFRLAKGQKNSLIDRSLRKACYLVNGKFLFASMFSSPSLSEFIGGFNYINPGWWSNMTKNPNQGIFKSIWEDNEEGVVVEEEPVRRDSIGRPTWWFNGSWFVPDTFDQRRWAKLQYQITSTHEKVLSTRATRLQRFIGLLSEWFPVPILDAVGKEILLETEMRQSEADLLAHFLGALEATLRHRFHTIRWVVLQEINQATGLMLKKKDIYKYVYYTRHRQKQPVPDTLKLIQRLTCEALTQEPLPLEQKRELYLQVIQAVKILHLKGFICKDPEVASWALKRILLNEKGVQKAIPEDLRSVTTRMTFRIRRLLKEKS
ncbi:MAG: hypothetical protein ACFFBD_10750, partial [Candidatus Hodarchaeota archaeon]